MLMSIYSCLESVSAGFGLSSGFGARSLLMVTAMPLRSLKTPVLTIGFARFQSRRDRNKIAARLADANKLLPDACDSLPVFSSFFFSITKTESP